MCYMRYRTFVGIPIKVFMRIKLDKAKIVINGSEEKLGLLIGEFEKMKVDIGSVSILLNSIQFQSDISAFLGRFMSNKGWKNHKQ